MAVSFQCHFQSSVAGLIFLAPTCGVFVSSFVSFISGLLLGNNLSHCLENLRRVPSNGTQQCMTSDKSLNIWKPFSVKNKIKLCNKAYFTMLC